MPVGTLTEITIIGFGNQAQAWALNLRDSGYQVHIGLRTSSLSNKAAEELKFRTFDFTQQPLPSELVCLLTPDHTHNEVLAQVTAHNSNKKFIFAHGYSLLTHAYPKIYPSHEFILLAPKAIASEVRFRFETKKPLHAFTCLDYSNLKATELQELAGGLGIHNLHPTSFQEETEADLFSEQGLLCSIIPYAILETYNTLIQRGYSHEIAFFESFYESKLIMDTLAAVGPEQFFKLISPNALIGSQVGKEKLLDENYRAKLDDLLRAIQDKSFDQTIASTNYEDLKQEVSLFWQNQQLTQTYLRLKDSL